jgi:hypothetical protein
MRAMAFQSITKFLPGLRWVLGSLLFIANEFGDLNLREPESREVIGSCTGRLPLALVRVGIVDEARPRHGFIKLGKTDLDPSGDKADHTSAVSAAITYPIYQSSPESDFEGVREVYMAGKGDEQPEKTIEEIQRETEEEIAWVAHLARDAERG